MRPRNSWYLHETTVLRRIACRLLSVVAPEESLVSERIVPKGEVATLIGEAAWISAGSSPMWGAAVLFRGIASLGSAWAGARTALHLASAVRSVLGEGLYGEGHLILTPGGPPNGWSCVEVSTESGSLVCAGVFPQSAAVDIRSTPTTTLRPIAVTARIFLLAFCRDVQLGADIALGRSLAAQVPDLNVVGVVVNSRCAKNNSAGGTVMMTVMGDSGDFSGESSSIAVRIDLGSLELSLAEVAALKPGAHVEIDGKFPAECFLRVGSTVLGRGILEAHDEGFVLRVEQVFE